MKRLDPETRRRRQQALLAHLIEKKVRSRALKLYELRGESEGGELQDWFQAESEVFGNNKLAPMYRRLIADTQAQCEEASSAGQPAEKA